MKEALDKQTLMEVYDRAGKSPERGCAQSLRPRCMKPVISQCTYNSIFGMMMMRRRYFLPALIFYIFHGCDRQFSIQKVTNMKKSAHGKRILSTPRSFAYIYPQLLLIPLVLFSLTTLLPTPPLYAGEKLVLSTFEADPFVISAGRIVREAYRRIAIGVEIVNLPGKRALSTANKGRVDGEVFRIKGIDKEYKNLLMVPVHVTQTETMVFTRNVKFPVKGWESLRPYSIGFVLGFLMAEKNTRGMEVFRSSTQAHVFKMLNFERTQVVIDSRMGGLAMIKQAGLTGIKPLEPPLNSVKVYHYLHKKHKKLLPEITIVLKEMHEQGIPQKIRLEVIDEFLK